MMLGIGGVRIGLPGRDIAGIRAGRAHIGGGHRIGRNQSGLAAELGRHVAQGHALGHGQRRDRLADILDDLVAADIHAELGAEMQHHVLGAHAETESALPVDQDGLGHLEPDLAGHEHAGHLGGADAEHEGAESAAGRRMAVAADDEHAGLQVAAFGQHDMADALHVVEIGDALLRHPVARELEDRGALGVDRRHVMVGNDDDARRVPDLGAETIQDRLGPARPAGIVDHGKVDLADDDLARPDTLSSRGARDDLFCEGCRHGQIPR